jgi:hypothetical protein
MQGTMSLSNCNMCSSQEMKEESSCCEKENNYPIHIKNDTNDKCCELKIIDSSVKENFLVVKQEFRTELTNLFIALDSNETAQKLNVVKVHQNFCDSSTPLQKTDIYLQNSVFLI